MELLINFSPQLGSRCAAPHDGRELRQWRRYSVRNSLHRRSFLTTTPSTDGPLISKFERKPELDVFRLFSQSCDLYLELASLTNCSVAIVWRDGVADCWEGDDGAATRPQPLFRSILLKIIHRQIAHSELKLHQF